MTAHLLKDLNPQQRAAAQATTGPVCIFAGAGSGKTTTLTRRIGVQVASGAFEARDVLALTFTARAAAQLRERLTKLGITGDIRARTFHAEALAQVSFFEGPQQLLASKASIIGPIVRRLPPPYKFKATKDVAAEIERAKNRRVSAKAYEDDTDDREPVLPRDLMARVYKAYEDRKARAGKLDFEDLLERAIALMHENPEAATRVRERYKAFSVDEYQDVNLLQHTLLDAWLDGRGDVCVVGDDYQSIYGFTGATPAWLLGFGERYEGAQVFELTHNYRSSPQVLACANRLVGALGGRSKKLEATRADGPASTTVEHRTGADETDAIVDEIRSLAEDGVAYEQMAILYRINARSEDYEEALAAARIPYQVRDGAFLRRPGARTALRLLSRSDASAPAAEAVESVAAGLGWVRDMDPSDADGTEEFTRLTDLGRLVSLAEAFEGTASEFVVDLKRRFEDEDARGVVLSTYHRAKGLEWDAVFLPRLEERELPFALAKGAEEVAEERRLLYVGITRARTYLRVSWAQSRDGKSVRRSRFAFELGSPNGSSVGNGSREPVVKEQPSDPELFERLRAWRKSAAEKEGVPAYVVFHDSTLRAICDRQPRTMADLSRVSGIGPAKLEKYGEAVVVLVVSA